MTQPFKGSLSLSTSDIRYNIPYGIEIKPFFNVNVIFVYTFCSVPNVRALTDRLSHCRIVISLYDKRNKTFYYPKLKICRSSYVDYVDENASFARFNLHPRKKCIHKQLSIIDI